MIHATTIEFLKKGKNLLAISGGIDSMVLADLLIKHKISFECAHVNFGLRGKESDEDEFFVSDWANKNQIKLHVNHHFKKSKSKKDSLQVQARNYRYAWFDELANDCGFHQIITAHHHTDNVETLLIQLLQGGSLAAIKGIEPQSGKLTRPLIHINRNQIEKYAQSHQIKFRSDSSNETDDYLRNKIRHHVLPILEQYAGNSNIISPSVFEHLRAENSILKHTADLFIQKTLIKNQYCFYFLKHDVLHHFNPKWALHNLLQHVQMHHSQLEKLLKLIAQPNTTGKKILTTSHEIELRADRVLIFDRHHNAQPSLDLSQLVLEYIDQSEITHFNTASNVAYFDADLVKSNDLALRFWNKGDRFFPFGMQGSKLLSDFYGNQKMNSKEKDFQPLLCLNNEIVWVINRRIDKRFAVTNQTKKVIKITFKSV